jgi:hypothetical protein
MTSMMINAIMAQLAAAGINWATATDIRALLMVGAGNTVKTDATVTAALANANVDECAATNYVRKTLSGKAATDSGNKVLLDADNLVWTALGGAVNETITGVLIYKGTLLSADDGTNVPLISLALASSLTTNGGDVTITKDATNKWGYLNNP